MLEENLRALEIRSPRVAQAVRRAAPRADLRWITTQEHGCWSAEVEGRALASKRRPVEEAQRLAESVDYASAAGIVVLGFGLGYHIAEISKRGGDKTAVIVFEPDLQLLRSVFEHADLSGMLRSGLIFVFTEAEDAAAMNEGLRGLEGLLGAGVAVVEHAPSTARLGSSGPRFAKTLTKVVAAMRTQIITTMTQMEATLRNLFMNLDHYAGGGGVAELKDLGAGCPAIVISAGPSLQRNLHLLEDPVVRDRCIIIAVQTMLKPLLARGIRPHFVTALDFHEISTRFYEGLTADDVEGVTLVAEPKANPAILEAFPGSIRLVEDETLSLLLGEELAPRHGLLQPGATVAHLAYYLARHLGCDPVILIGQDLAFTDGQYYAAGAAIHDVWATELNPFNTLEMMEWQRIVRWRGHLHEVLDQLGRRVYTDDQMSTYLAQFERDFLIDSERGFTTIDATEGGARKAHTRVELLEQALRRHAGDAARRVPAIPPAPRRGEPSSALRRRIREVRDGIRAAEYLCKRAEALLTQMLEHATDQARINRLIAEVHEIRDQVQARQPAYALIHKLNQTGAFKRFRADRTLGLCQELDPVARQRRQIERDRMNIEWLRESARSIDDLLGATSEMLEGGPKRMRDIVAPRGADEAMDSIPIDVTGGFKAAAVIVLAPGASGGERELTDSRAVVLTIGRLSRCKRLNRIVLVSTDPAAAQFAQSHATAGAPIEILAINPGPCAPGRSVQAGRMWSDWCWRGGLGGLTCYDEVFDAETTIRALESCGSSAALIVGPQWSLVDPGLCDAVISRHFENPDRLPLVFTQAPPGLAGCVISKRLAADLARGRSNSDAFATIGGLLGFHPLRPRLDPVAKNCCVQIDAGVRSSPWRFIPDGSGGAWLDAVLSGIDRDRSDAAAMIRMVESAALRGNVGAPRHLVIDARIAAVDVRRILEEFIQMNPCGCVSLSCAEPAELAERVALARSLGLRGVHARTNALGDPSAFRGILQAGPDVVSIDLYATTRATYELLTGADRFDEALRNTELLLTARTLEGGLPYPWIVPRITRRDATYEEVEGFFDRGLLFAASCVIDPLPRPIPGERILPLPFPRAADFRRGLTELVIDVPCDSLVELWSRNVAHWMTRRSGSAA